MASKIVLACCASWIGLLGSGVARGQDATDPAAPAPVNDGTAVQDQYENDIVVTGFRRSLERSADIKRDAVQVVDAVVAEDIGKLPDPTTAAALQRIPGIQVSVNRNNELGDVRVRGLPDVMTTVNGREVFTTTGRGFDLKDMPAQALGRIDVYKSQTADLIEGGLAGNINLNLNRPFDFRRPTIVATARGNYGERVDKLNGQYGLLATTRFDTGIGEIGILANGSYSRTDYYRAQTISRERRSTATTPLNTPGILIPNILQNFPEEGFVERGEFNAAVNWQATPDLQVYAEGFYTTFRDRGAQNGANIQPFTTGVTIGDFTPSDRCISASVSASGQNPTTGVIPAAQTLCEPESITFNDLVSNQTTQARNNRQFNKQFAGGFKYDGDRMHALFDISYQTSNSRGRNIVSDIGQRLPSLTLEPDVDGVARYTVPGDALLSRDNLFIRNALIQDYSRTDGNLFQVRADLDHDVDSVITNIAGGVRYARRAALAQSVNLNRAIPGGNIGTPSEATAVRVADTGLPDDFLALGSVAPDLNGGSRFYIANPAFLLNERSLDLARAYFRLAPGRPAYDATRALDALETTMGGYVQAKYAFELGESAVLDGVVGLRYVETERSIGTARLTAGVLEPLSARTTDSDLLPNATMRLKFENGLQARLGYQQSIRRPDFASLNPALTLNLSNNPLVQSGGSGGNPDLRVQKSQSYDATLEYYFRGGYIAVAGYYRNITDRVINGVALETYDGVAYAVTRPRNVGEAELKGVEVSSQYFFDSLPGALSGIGLQGAFTYADSEIGGADPLAGNPLQGVSRYNFSSGLLYEKYGISGRVIYTYRSRYFDADNTGSPTVRPVGQPTLLSYVRPAGRLDFSVGYDISEALRIDIAGTNILRNITKQYFAFGDATRFNHEVRYDETTYSAGIRVRF